jgi:hypothetical protein
MAIWNGGFTTANPDAMCETQEPPRAAAGDPAPL